MTDHLGEGRPVSRWTYRQGCRCDDCTRANRKRATKERQARRDRAPEPPGRIGRNGDGMDERAARIAFYRQEGIL